MDDIALKEKVAEILKDDRDLEYKRALSFIKKFAEGISSYLGIKDSVKVSSIDVYDDGWKTKTELCRVTVSLYEDVLFTFIIGCELGKTYPIKIHSIFVHDPVSDNWNGDEVNDYSELMEVSLSLLRNPRLRLIINNAK